LPVIVTISDEMEHRYSLEQKGNSNALKEKTRTVTTILGIMPMIPASLHSNTQHNTSREHQGHLKARPHSLVKTFQAPGVFAVLNVWKGHSNVVGLPVQGILAAHP
jgi:hypothetical protein